MSHTTFKLESRSERKSTIIISRCRSHRLERRAKQDKTDATSGGPGTEKKVCLPKPLICFSVLLGKEMENPHGKEAGKQTPKYGRSRA